MKSHKAKAPTLALVVNGAMQSSMHVATGLTTWSGAMRCGKQVGNRKFRYVCGRLKGHRGKHSPRMTIKELRKVIRRKEVRDATNRAS